MHPRIREVLEYLDTHRAALKRAVAAVSPELRGRRPAPERWSVAEVLEHLGLVERHITRLLQNLISEGRAAGIGPEQETSLVVPTLDLSRLLNRSRREPASDAAKPREGLDASAAEAALVRQREALRATLLSADGLALAEVSAPNPVLGVLNASQWVLFIGGHEARHTAQIQEIAAALQDAQTHLPPA
jgi:hypothetical protein